MVNIHKTGPEIHLNHLPELLPTEMVDKDRFSQRINDKLVHHQEAEVNKRLLEQRTLWHKLKTTRDKLIKLETS